jgi:hypothetical protein
LSSLLIIVIHKCSLSVHHCSFFLHPFHGSHSVVVIVIGEGSASTETYTDVRLSKMSRKLSPDINTYEVNVFYPFKGLMLLLFLSLVNILGQAILGQAILGQAILGQAILGQSILGQAILGQAILGQAILGQAILGQCPWAISISWHTHSDINTYEVNVFYPVKGLMLVLFISLGSQSFFASLAIPNPAHFLFSLPPSTQQDDLEDLVA